eukprot:4191354-Alexandrium_andersonii.AAC.1
MAKGIRGSRRGGLRIGVRSCALFATSDPPIHIFVGGFGSCARKGSERTLGSFGDKFEAVLGPAQFKPRTPEAISRCAHGGLRVEAACSAGGP